VKSWVKLVADIPECDLKAEVLSNIKAFLKDLGEVFAKAFAEPYRKGMPKPEPEPEPEPEQERKRDSTSGVPSASPTSLRESPKYSEEFVEHWNFMAKRAGVIPTIKKFDAKRKKALSSCMKDEFWAKTYKEAIDRIPSCPFLMGDNDRGWKANVDWFLRTGTATKILEGNYSGKKGAGVQVGGRDTGRRLDIKNEDEIFDDPE
jgi:hypothetical protein